MAGRFALWRLHRLVHVRRHYLYRYAIPEFSPERFRPPVEHLVVRVIESPEDCRRLVEEGFDDPRAKSRSFQRRLDAGAVAVCGFVSGRFAYGGWVATTNDGKRSFDSLPYRVDFSSGEAVTGGAFTMPEYRGLGLYRYLFGHELQYLRGMGRTVCRNAISVDNYASQRGQAFYDAEVCAYARDIRVLFFRRWTERPMSGPCPSRAGRPRGDGKEG